MTVGVLIITHERLATVLADIAVNMLGHCPLPMAIVPVTSERDPDLLRDEARSELQALDEGDGVLVLTDIYGSTPSNVAQSLLQASRVVVVAGINLPMLVRVMNYPHLSLPDLAGKAVSGGRDGVFASTEGKDL